MFILSPLLGRTAIPNTAKVGLALLTALIIINYNPPAADFAYSELWPLLGAVIRELSVGLVMGFVTILYFNIVYAAGHIIDMQIGFSMAQTFDATIGGQAPVSASLLNIIMMTSFVFSDGITKLIHTVAVTFDQIPVGSALIAPELAETATDLFAKCFILSVQIAMPVLASALLTEVALGVIVRTAPQMNVFVVGIPIKVIVGLIILAFMIPIFVMATGGLFDQMYYAMDSLLGGMIP